MLSAAAVVPAEGMRGKQEAASKKFKEFACNGCGTCSCGFTKTIKVRHDSLSAIILILVIRIAK
jgi:hypothetical protein